MNGVVWVTGSLDVRGPISGTGTIVVDGTINAQAGYVPQGISNVVFTTTSSSSNALSLHGNGEFHGVLYAPNGGVSLSGTPDFFGSILADDISFNGTPTITRWTDFGLNSPPLPGAPKVLGWQAL